jgi:putative membrane protein
MNLLRLRRRPDPIKGALAGLVGGLGGAWAMNQFQASLRKAMENCSGSSGKPMPQDSDDATTRTAQWLLKCTTGFELTPEQKQKAGPLVHYLFGGAMGAVYGALLERKGKQGLREGALLGGVLFLGADELMVPALKLSKSPAEYPLSVHASALAAHLVYGLTTEEVRRKVRRALLFF